MFDPERFPPEEEIPPELMSRGGLKPDKKIFSIQVGTVTFFNIGDHLFSEGLTFALEPGVIIEDVKVTVKSRLQIRGRVVYADGTPLANAEADLTMEQSHETRPNHGGSLSTNFFTDAGGYFTEYVEEPGFYTLSVEYNDLSAGAGPFLLKDGVQPEEIVLTLEGKPEPVEPPLMTFPSPVTLNSASHPRRQQKACGSLIPRMDTLTKKFIVKTGRMPNARLLQKVHTSSLSTTKPNSIGLRSSLRTNLFGSGSPIWKRKVNGSGIAVNLSPTPTGQPIQCSLIGFQTLKRIMSWSPLDRAGGNPPVLKVRSGAWHDGQSSKRTDWFLR